MNNRAEQEIRARIEQARATFLKMKHLLVSRHISIELTLRIVRCYVFPVLLYGLESWTPQQDVIKKLEAFEMWTYRRMLRISWVEHITNIQVLDRMSKQKEILNNIKIRKLQYLGHISRNSKYQLLQLIIQGKIQGKRNIGRRTTS